MRFKAEGLAIELPENPAPYLVDWLMEIGPMASGGMGHAPLGWTAIKDWQELVGVELNPWEARTIRLLSRDFVDQMNKSREATCPAPFVTNPKSNDDAVTEQFRQMFAAMKKK